MNALLSQTVKLRRPQHLIPKTSTAFRHHRRHPLTPTSRNLLGTRLHIDRYLGHSHYTMSTSSTTPRSISVAILGVGLVGAEFINQLLSFPAPTPFRIVSLSSSKVHFFHPDGLPITTSTWRSEFSGALNKLNLDGLIRELSTLVTPAQKVVLVDNTSSPHIASLYPTILTFGIDIITPNKKAFSGDLSLYESILSASLDSGARFLGESTVGAGLPVISTLKDLVATGDKVRFYLLCTHPQFNGNSGCRSSRSKEYCRVR